MNPMEIAMQMPAVGAILLISFWFLKALKNRDCTLKDIADRCHELRSDATDAMRDNSRVVGQNTELLREVTTILRRINGSKP